MGTNSADLPSDLQPCTLQPCTVQAASAYVLDGVGID